MEFASGNESHDPLADSKSFLDEERASETIASKIGLENQVKSSIDDDFAAGEKEGERKTDEIADSKEPQENGLDKEPDEWMDILGNGHIRKRVIIPGEKDTRPQKSDLLKVSYVNTLENGTIVENLQLAAINLGDYEVVQGLDLALSLMDCGEEAEIIIHSRFGYGDSGRAPDIPSGATLNYKIKLLSVEPEPLISTLGYEERMAVGLRKKERGNWWYSRDDYSVAINLYRRALEYFDDTEFIVPVNDDQIKSLIDERLKTYNNLGAAQIKIHGYDAALISFGHVLAAQPNNVKALFRKSTILREKGELSEAIAVMQKALSIEPNNVRLQSDLQKLLAAQRRDNTKQREMYKKMMGTSADAKKKPAQKTSALRWIALATTIVVGVGSVVAMRYGKI